MGVQRSQSGGACCVSSNWRSAQPPRLFKASLVLFGRVTTLRSGSGLFNVWAPNNARDFMEVFNIYLWNETKWELVK